jgi:succinylglutamate desuccinylase
MSQLKTLDYLPDGFLTITAREIKTVFDTPTLIHLKGKKRPALFVSILLHGNEFSGLTIMQQLLKKYKTKIGYELPRDLWLFVGNVNAAAQGLRTLENEVDFNRAWRGTADPTSPTAKLIQEVMDTITQDDLFAAVDLHNNTGQNPHYGCISVVNEANKYLCTLFNHIGMVFTSPKGVSTIAFDDICPAITLECSTPGNQPAIEKAFTLVDDLMHLDRFPTKDVVKQDLQLVQNSATVKIDPDIAFSFENDISHLNDGLDLAIIDNFDHHNFTSLEVGEVFAFTHVKKPFVITAADGTDITNEMIINSDGNISLKTRMMPAMISVDEIIVRQDCLCYLLEDYER